MGIKASALPPAYAEGQQVYNFSVDLAGALRMTGGGGGTSDQGAPATLGNAWPVKLTDGTDVFAVNADGSGNVDVIDRDGRLLGRAKLLSAAGAVIDPATETTLALVRAKTDNLDVALSTRTKPADLQLVDERRAIAVLFAVVDVAGAGDNTIVTADVSNKIKVLSYTLVADAAVTARWKSGAGTSLSGAMALAANGGVASPVATAAGGHLFETALNQALVLNLGAAVGVRGHLSYFKEA
jgi:hypothetical protein